MSNPVDPFAPPPDRFPRNYSQFDQKTADDTQEVPTVSPAAPPPIPQSFTPPPRSPVAPPPAPGRPPDGAGKDRKRMVAAVIIGGIFLGLIAGGGAAFLVTGGAFDDLVGGEDSSAPSGSQDESPSSAPDEDGGAEGMDTAPTMPTKLGAWWAREGVYAAKWEEPQDTGGGAVTGYVIAECESGEELAELTGDEYAAAVEEDAGAYEVEFKAKDLNCVSVRATNYVGAGEEATFDIEEE